MNSLESERKERTLKIFNVLGKVYPEARPLLNYENAYQLLVATILAAQCTDERVNKVTPDLFKRFPDARSMICAQVNELEQIIKSTGFFRNKTRNLKKLCFALVDKYQGMIPDTIQELVALPGIGRKTANVILGHCYNKAAIVVDTHFKRVTARLELTRETNPDKIEHDMRGIIPEDIQTSFSDVINWHGRFRCKARKPECEQCQINTYCPFPKKATKI